MRILISGGGIAGLTLAYWLRRRGMEPVVLERSDHGRLGGYGIDFFGTGYDIATRMGIVDRLSATPLPVDSVDFLDADGAVAARLDKDLLDTIIQGPHLGLMHDVLEEALLDGLPGTAEIRYATSLTQVRQTDDGVEAQLNDGTVEHFDALVGADGIHSRTRELVFGDESRFARYLGCQLASYPVLDHYGWGRTRAHYTEPGRQVIVYPTGEPERLIALLLFKTTQDQPVSRDQRHAALHARFGDMGWITPRLLDQAPDDGSIFMDVMAQVVMPDWHRGRVALVGDACGCMTMVSAQGVSMAMADAYVLAEELGRHADPTHAFAAYQHRMRPHVTKRQRTARAFARSLVPGTATGVRASRAATKAIMRKRFAPLLRRQFGTESILAPEGEQQ